MISIVVPVYNAKDTIEALLRSIFSSDFSDFETILVDDCSTDNSAEIINRYPVKLFKLTKNCGPAQARNIGANEARGDILLFLDSDVVLSKDALTEAVKAFNHHRKIKAMIGIYHKEPANKGLAPKYKALFYHSTFKNYQKETTSEFDTAIGAVYKETFEKIGGFDTRYPGPDSEDNEFGYRILKEGEIYFNKNVVIKHHFPGFWVGTKKYFWRAFYWMRLFLKRKKFDDLYFTPFNGLGNLVGFISLILWPLSWFSSHFLFFSLAFLLFFMGIYLKFYLVCLREEGILFMLTAIGMSYLFCISLSLGAIISIFTLPIDFHN